MKQFYLLLSMLFLSLSVSAQVVYVNTAATGSNDGTSWANAFTDLTAALDAASNGDAIWIAAGVYTPVADSSFVVTKELTLIGGFNGTETSADQADLVNNFTLLSGDIAGDDDPADIQVNRADNVRIMRIDSLSAGVNISNLVFSGGQTGIRPSDTLSIRPFSGGAILSVSAVNISDCLFASNFGNFAAGIALYDAAAGSTIENSLFTANVSTGIAAAIGIFTDGVSITNCEVVQNLSERGAIYSQGFLTAIDSCDVSENQALGRGPAISLVFATGSSVTNTTIRNNQVLAGGLGGALYIGTTADAAADANDFIVHNCIFEGNASAGNFGGAMLLLDANVTITDCEFTSNSTPGRGGAIWATNNAVADTKILDIRRTTFNDNQNGEAGLAATIYTQQAFTFEIDSCTFLENGSTLTGNRGSAICSLGDFTAGSTRPQAMNVRNSAFIFNQVNNFGGAIFVQTNNHFTTLNFDNVDFIGNGSATQGGAIITLPNCFLNMNNCYSEFNTSGDGGVIFAIEDVTINNSIFAQNFASTQGGVMNIADGKDLTVTNSVFYGNLLTAMDAGAGGAIIVNGDSAAQQTALLVNNTFYGNAAGALGDDVAIFRPLFVGPESFSRLVLQNNAFTSTTGNANASIELGEPVIISEGGNFFAQDVADFTPLATDMVDTDIDPDDLFVSVDDLDEADLRINTDLEGNPLIGNGVAGPNVPANDIDGNARGAAIDIGAYVSEAAPVLPTVAEIIAASEVHNALETALNGAGLTATLNGEGPFTVFAPTDAAFAALSSANLSLLAEGNNMTNTLLTHVISGLTLSTDITDGLVVPALAPNTNLNFGISGGTVTVATGFTSAVVTVADLLASNGVVHVIDMVLIPLIVDVRDLDAAGIDVTFFPNPVKDQMNVQINDLNLQDMRVSIINLNGQRLNQWTLGNGSNFIDFSRVPAGAYTLEINIDGKLYSKQVVKQ